jgi:uncharacterized protein YcbK (DUF882 family)
VFLNIEMPASAKLRPPLLNASLFHAALGCASMMMRAPPGRARIGIERFAGVPRVSCPNPHHSSLGRRGFIALSTAAGCAFPFAACRPARAARPARELSFHSLRTDETLTAVYREDGRLLPDGLAQLDYILRDYRTGDVRPIAAGLLDLVHELKQAMDYRQPIDVISGYRSPATNAMLAARSKRVAKNSYHLRGMAVDIRMPGRPLAELRDAALSLRRGGVGYYPESDFVHVDVGPVRSW